jgi:preprotein translocase subunit SecD
MDFVSRRFNIYLLAALSALLFCGCATHKKKEILTSLRVHAEAKDNTTFTRKITVFEESPIEMTVDQSTLVTDTEVTKASVVEALGGFALVIQFDKRGQWLLDQHSSLNIGRHLAIFAQYGEKPVKTRWIAVPIISNRISDGALIFTPDVTREEAEQIAKGLGIKKGFDKPAKEEK